MHAAVTTATSLCGGRSARKTQALKIELLVEVLLCKKNDKKGSPKWYQWAQQERKYADEAERKAVLREMDPRNATRSTRRASTGCSPGLFTSCDSKNFRFSSTANGKFLCFLLCRLTDVRHALNELSERSP